MILPICGTNKKDSEKENRWVVVRGGIWRMGKAGEGDQKVQTSNNKRSKFWGCNVQLAACS